MDTLLDGVFGGLFDAVDPLGMMLRTLMALLADSLPRSSPSLYSGLFEITTVDLHHGRRGATSGRITTGMSASLATILLVIAAFRSMVAQSNRYLLEALPGVALALIGPQVDHRVPARLAAAFTDLAQAIVAAATPDLAASMRLLAGVGSNALYEGLGLMAPVVAAMLLFGLTTVFFVLLFCMAAAVVLYVLSPFAFAGLVMAPTRAWFTKWATGHVRRRVREGPHRDPAGPVGVPVRELRPRPAPAQASSTPAPDSSSASGPCCPRCSRTACSRSWEPSPTRPAVPSRQARARPWAAPTTAPRWAAPAINGAKSVASRLHGASRRAPPHHREPDVPGRRTRASHRQPPALTAPAGPHPGHPIDTHSPSTVAQPRARPDGRRPRTRPSPRPRARGSPAVGGLAHRSGAPPPPEPPRPDREEPPGPRVSPAPRERRQPASGRSSWPARRQPASPDAASSIA